MNSCSCRRWQSICSDGSTIWAAIPRLAAYSKLSERKVQRLIHGEDRGGRHVPGLCDRGILSKLALGNAAKRRPTTYRINEAAFQDDPKMTPYRVRQRQLPGIYRVPVPGEPIPDRPLVSTGHQTGVPRAAYLVSSGHQSGVTGTPDSKSFDSRTTDSKPVIQHGDAALNAMPAWMSFKEQLQVELSPEEWELFGKRMFLLKAMPLNADQKHLLAAIPPNGRIIHAAQKRLPLMKELLAPAGLNISLTRYPDQWEIDEAKRRYGADIAPKPWARNT